MGTISEVARAGGKVVYRAQVRAMKDGVQVARESKNFPDKRQAQAWVKRREVELESEMASDDAHLRPITMLELVEQYKKRADGITAWGRSKWSDIERLSKSPLMHLDARRISAKDFIKYAENRRLKDGAGPATVLNDIIWLRQVLLSAVVMFNLKSPLAAIDAAKQDLLRSKVIAKPIQRKRRVTPEEESKIIDYYDNRSAMQSIPMSDIVRFALLTARRQEEITKLKWVDVDFEKGIAWLDDVKHPTKKKGNRRCFRILKPALEIINRQPKNAPEVFPYSSRSISTSFTRAMPMLGIDDLHFHDLRHEATSRLFERGYSIQEVAQFTLHESWTTLKRYTHLKPESIPEL